jgi:hypothetical protein
MSNFNKVDDEARQIIIDLIVEGWRFSKLFAKVLSKLDAGEGHRYVNQFNYFLKQLQDKTELAQLKIVNVEGLNFDPGMAVTPLNIEDFSPNTLLIVDQMMEPIIMGPDGIIKTGTVILKKASV